MLYGPGNFIILLYLLWLVVLTTGNWVTPTLVLLVALSVNHLTFRLLVNKLSEQYSHILNRTSEEDQDVQ